MTDTSLHIKFLVDQTPIEVFEAIRNVKGWWSGDVVGDTRTQGAEFTYNVPGIHFCRMKISQSVPGEAIAWDVLESNISYIADHNEWANTRIRFEISQADGKTSLEFIHEGLVPEIECFTECTNAWGLLVSGNLKRLIVTGEDQPNAFGG